MTYTPGDPTKRYLDNLSLQVEEARQHESRKAFHDAIIPAYIVLAATELRTEVGGVIAGRHFEAHAGEALKVSTPALVRLRHRTAELLANDTYADPFVGDLAFKPDAYLVFQENTPKGFQGIRDVVRICSEHEQRVGALASEAWAAFDLQAVKL